MAKRKFGDVIVVLPGITGSVLARGGKDIWAVSKGAAWQALISLGRSSEMPPLPPAIYRLRVTDAEGGLLPTTDLITVLDPL